MVLVVPLLWIYMNPLGLLCPAPGFTRGVNRATFEVGGSLGLIASIWFGCFKKFPETGKAHLLMKV